MGTGVELANEAALLAEHRRLLEVVGSLSRDRASLLEAFRAALEHLRDWKEPGVEQLMRWGILLDRIEGYRGG